MVVRRALLERIGGFRAGYEGAQDYDLVLRLIEQTTRIHHLPKVLYHWRRIPESTAGSETAKPWAHDAGRLALQDYVRRNNLDAEIVPGELHVPVSRPVCDSAVSHSSRSSCRRSLPRRAAESVDACERTLRTLADRTSYRRFEVRRRDADERADDRLRRRSAKPCHIARCEVDRRRGPAASSQLRWRRRTRRRSSAVPRLGTARARPRLADRPPRVSRSRRPSARLGRKLLYPDGSLKHIGIVLGVNGVAAPAFHRHPRSSLGYWGTAIAARNYSAVSGACMMTRRRLFEEVGGFRGRDGLFCRHRLLPARDRGRLSRGVHASRPLVHTDSADSLDGAAVNRDRRTACARCGAIASRTDPYYNANFSRDTPDYEPELSAAASNVAG